MTLSDDASRGSSNHCGGTIVDVEQQARWRTQHFLTLERHGEHDEVLARSAAIRTWSRGSKLLQHFDIAHEARVLEALQGHGLKVPEFFGFSDGAPMILMERHRWHEPALGRSRRRHATAGHGRILRAARAAAQPRHRHRWSVSEDLDPHDAGGVAFAGKFAVRRRTTSCVRSRLAPGAAARSGGLVAARQRAPGRATGQLPAGRHRARSVHVRRRAPHRADRLGAVPYRRPDARPRRRAGCATCSIRRARCASRSRITKRCQGRPIDWQALCFYTVMSMLLTPIGVSISMQRFAAMTDMHRPGSGGT